MLDGAGASTALDVIDERSKDKLLNKNIKKYQNYQSIKLMIILKNFHLIK